MKCSVCGVIHKPSELDRITLVCDKCAEEISKIWDIKNRYFKEVDRELIEFIELQNRYFDNQIKVMKNILVGHGEYGYMYKWVEVN